MKKLFAAAFIVGIAMSSCQSDVVDPADIDITAAPVISLPLGEIGLTMDHLLVPDDSLIFDDNATYKVIVAQDSVFGIDVNDLIIIPVQSPSSSSISMGTVAVSNVSLTQGIALGAVAADAGLTAISAAHGSNAPFPQLNESNVGTYGGSGFGTFTSASFSNGTLTFNNTNSSIVDVFTLPKDSITYGGSVNVNHDTATFGTENFVTNSSSISGDLLMEMPFYFTATGLGFYDTLATDQDNSSVLPENAGIESAVLLLQTTSTLPLDASLNLKFYDANWNTILVKDLGLMESGIPDANGIITAASVLDSELELNALEASSVLDAVHITAETTMDTYNVGSVPVKLRTDATLVINLGVQFKINVTL